MTDVTPSPEDRLAVSIDEGPPATFVLAGDLDPHTSPMLQTKIDETLADGADTAVLDVAGVGFTDSAGLRVIADTHRRLSEAGGALVIRRPSAALEKLLAVTGLADHVTVEPR
ncbi:STAS domain-containing protein [Actinospongicola halichondriae]|uniref:STAS domain-containing protein n=1 Tax=Actinospongicola halichondriae TaxID=3236844 RepID=UPI003D37FC4A